MIKKIELVPYDLPLRQHWVSSNGEITHRHGVLIKLTTADYLAYGDCAPLPQVGTETLEQAKNWLIQRIHKIKGRDVNTALSMLEDNNAYPAARCGLETALLDLCAQMNNTSLARYLNKEAVSKVQVNASCGTLYKTVDFDELDRNYSVIKFKVGIKSVEDELMQLQQLMAKIPPGTQLRLDANGAWSYDDAVKFVKGCGDFPIESIEEPLKEPQLEYLQQLQEASGFVIAMDESLIKFDTKVILDKKPVKRLIIKPMREGGLLASLSLAQQAYSVGMDCVITTTVDSAAGVWAATQLAAALGPAGENITHGLATSNWLVKDIGPAPEIINGIINLQGIKGLGFREIFSG